MGNTQQNEKSPQVLAYAALVKAQSQFTTIAKNKEAVIPTKKGGQFKFKYADLAATVEMVRPVMNENGFAIIQPLLTVDKVDYIDTLLLHESGFVIESRLELPHPSEDAGDYAKEFGTGVSYWRRYALTSILGVVSDEDVDINGGEKSRQGSGGKSGGGSKKPDPKAPPKAQAPPKSSQAPANNLGALKGQISKLLSDAVANGTVSATGRNEMMGRVPSAKTVEDLQALLEEAKGLVDGGQENREREAPPDGEVTELVDGDEIAKKVFDGEVVDPVKVAVESPPEGLEGPEGDLF